MCFAVYQYLCLCGLCIHINMLCCGMTVHVTCSVLADAAHANVMPTMLQILSCPTLHATGHGRKGQEVTRTQLNPGYSTGLIPL